VKYGIPQRILQENGVNLFFKRVNASTLSY
jgi:hypothetical protein